MSTRPASEAADGGEPARKRIRKGTKSCWECKRRKVRCQLSSEDVPVCSGCVSRGTTCLSQEYPEERDPSSGTQVGERLARVEQLLESLVAKFTKFEEEEETQKIMTPDSIGADVINPYADSVGPSHVTAAPPFLDLFNNPVLQRDNSQALIAAPVSQASGSKTPSCTVPKLERTRQALVDLLPSQSEITMISEASSSWLLIHALTAQTSDHLTFSVFDKSEVIKQHPTKIARTILYLAVCLQQLDPNFDTAQLHLYPSIEARIEKYLVTIQALITSDDELASTVHGMECLVLSGVFHINAGNPRRAWLMFRRALNIAQLQGMHHKDCTIPGGREMWYQIVQSDRYLALFLGLPTGSVDVGFGPDETFQNPSLNKDKLFARKLCNLSGRTIDRNQAETPHVYTTTQEIDQALDSLAKEMPKGWWAIPDEIRNDRSELAAIQFDRLMTQIWFFQLESLLHLPFMLRAATERRYDYSRFTCLKASREMIYRYLALRNAKYKAFCCKVVDFGCLTATVTIFLGLLEPVTSGESTAQKQQRETDRNLVHQVLASTEELAKVGKDVVAIQSTNVIKSLLAIDDGRGQNTGNLKLTIPYFGTISILRPTPETPRPSPATLNPNTPYNSQQLQEQQPVIQQRFSQPWQSLGHIFDNQNDATHNFANVPMVSFESNQFYSLVSGHPLDWDIPEADTMFFDSLLSTDIESDWIY